MVYTADDYLASLREKEEEERRRRQYTTSSTAPIPPPTRYGSARAGGQAPVLSYGHRQKMLEAGAVPTSQISEVTGPLPGDPGMGRRGFFTGMVPLAYQSVLRAIAAPLAGVGEIIGLVPEGVSQGIKEDFEAERMRYLASSPNPLRAVVAGGFELGADMIPLVSAGVIGRVGAYAANGVSRMAKAAGAGRKAVTGMEALAYNAAPAALEGSIFGLGEMADEGASGRLMGMVMGGAMGGTLGGMAGRAAAQRLANDMVRIDDALKKTTDEWLPDEARAQILDGTITPRRAALQSLGIKELPDEMVEPQWLLRNDEQIHGSHVASISPRAAFDIRESGSIGDTAVNAIRALRDEGAKEPRVRDRLVEIFGSMTKARNIEKMTRRGRRMPVFAALGDSNGAIMPGSVVSTNKAKVKRGSPLRSTGEPVNIQKIEVFPDELQVVGRGNEEFRWIPRGKKKALKTVRKQQQGYLRNDPRNIEMMNTITAREAQIVDAVLPVTSELKPGSFQHWAKKKLAANVMSFGDFKMEATRYTTPQAKRFVGYELPRLLEKIPEHRNARMFQADQISREVRKEVKRYARKSGKSVEEVGDMLTNIRRGNLKVVDAKLPERLTDAAERANRFIDDLSAEFIEKDLIHGSLIDTFKKNMGEYLSISYAKHDEKGYRHRVQDSAVWDETYEWFQRTWGRQAEHLDPSERWSDGRILATMMDITTKKDKADFVLFLTQESLEKQRFTETMHRKNIPEQIQKLMGIRTDFDVVFKQTVSSMIHDLVTTDVRREIIKRGLASGAFSPEKTGLRFREIPLDVSPATRTRLEALPADKRSVLRRGRKVKLKATGKRIGKVKNFTRDADGNVVLEVDTPVGTTMKVNLDEVRTLKNQEFRPPWEPKGPKYKKVEPPGEVLPASVYADEPMEAIILGLDSASPGGIMAAVNGLIKWGKVGYSPTTQIRNFITGFMFSMHTGAFNPLLFPATLARAIPGSFVKSIAKAGGVAGEVSGFHRTALGSAMREGIASNWTRAETFTNNLASIVQDLHARGMMATGTNAKELLRYQEDIAFVINKSELFGHAKEKVPKGLRKFLGASASKVELAYRMGDDFWKAVNYWDELQNLQWATRGTENKAVLDALEVKYGTRDIKNIAAERVKETVQTYSRTARIARKLSRFPLVGPFVTFHMEMPRNLKNNLKIAAENYGLYRATGEARFAGLAAKRFSGTMQGLAVLATAAAGMKYAMGWSDEEEDALRDTFMYEFARNNHIIPLTRTPQDAEDWEKGKRIVRFLDLQYLEPQTLLSKYTKILMRDIDFGQKMEEMADETESLYAGWELGMGALLEQFMNRELRYTPIQAAITGKGLGPRIWNPEDPLMTQFQKRAFALFNKTAPGGAVSLHRILRSMGVLEVYPNDDERFSTSVELAALVGSRVISMDLERALMHRFYQFNERKADIASTVNRAQRDVERGASLETLDVAQRNAQEKWNESWGELQTHVESARTWGFSDKEISSMLKGILRKDQLRKLMRGQPPTKYPKIPRPSIKNIDS